MVRQRITTLLMLVIMLLSTLPALAANNESTPQLSAEMQRLIEQKVDELLAQRLATIPTSGPHSIDKPTIAKSDQHQIVAEVVQSLTLSGVVEVEANHTEDYDGNSTSGLELATVELAVDAQAHPWVQGHVLFLYEEGDEDDVVIDEAFITIGNNDVTPFYLNAGRLYVPFGNFTTFMISDPLTLEMGETQETAVQIGYNDENWHASMYTFNGDTSEGDEFSTIEQFGAHLGYSLEREAWNLAVDASYASSLFDSDSLSEEYEDAAVNGDYIPGLGLHAVIGIADLTLIGEYIAALEELDVDGEHIDPYTFNLEVAYTLELLDRETAFALAWQGSDDLVGFLPEQRFMASVGISLFDDTALTVEYTHDEDYDTSDGGSDDSSNSLTAQLAYEF
ncbi:MAG: LbtU family siderophore porin [Desulfuromonas sp.]|nr:LbtU family siderophore porin [Desulfuromonas sp.]